MRIQLTIRNKMFLFFSVVMPFGFFFLYAGVFAKGVPDGVRYLLGPVVGLTVMGSFWGLSAALVMFREQGILRRFHVTPVTPSGHAGFQRGFELHPDLAHGIARNSFLLACFFRYTVSVTCWRFLF